MFLFTDITELGRSARTYCELSGRTIPMVTDISMAVVEMGVDVSGLKTYAKRLSRSRIPHRKFHITIYTDHAFNFNFLVLK